MTLYTDLIYTTYLYTLSNFLGSLVVDHVDPELHRLVIYPRNMNPSETMCLKNITNASVNIVQLFLVVLFHRLWKRKYLHEGFNQL